MDLPIKNLSDVNHCFMNKENWEPNIYIVKFNPVKKNGHRNYLRYPV